ncbi:EboA domain-containing protein [Cellvibrio sp. pealriver]|uniref:EboA domain-containing protein n=1 Tax=Cellvibrio sp. pealriver TaxID=1622269 RepID=UPI00066FBF6D|nr:EboA domain-containing protein [Cellvibrio sp. pealriver]
MISPYLAFLNSMLAGRVNATAQEFIQRTQDQIATGVTDDRFTQLVALASRHVPRQMLNPTSAELEQAAALISGWSPKAWSLLDTVRVSFILARADLAEPAFAQRFNQWFRFADEGESCAYYRALCLLPEPQQHIWRAAEGCRTNMRSVFAAVACDSPYPFLYFDDLAWNQMLLKALFIGEPLQHIYGFNLRTTAELITMVNDYVDERCSAGRDIPADVRLLIG